MEIDEDDREGISSRIDSFSKKHFRASAWNHVQDGAATRMGLFVYIWDLRGLPYYNHHHLHTHTTQFPLAYMIAAHAYSAH